MGALARGEVVLFPFLYTDLSNRKLRPCLVLSGEMGEDILLCQITSKSIRKDKFTVLVKKGDTLGGSLMIDSYVRANMIFTASIGQIHRRLCSIKDQQYKAVVKIITDLVKK